MKKLTLWVLVLLSVSYASAALCVDVKSSLVRGTETTSVFSLQKFLSEKGFLKAVPNGYFGGGTFTAVKLYQKSMGLAQVGVVGPATRAAIKKETCIVSTLNTTVIATTTLQGTSTQPVIILPVPTVSKTPSALRNEKRKEDLEALLKSLYAYFVDSRGVQITQVSDVPNELCVSPISNIDTSASGTEVAVVVTPVSPCATYVDVAYLLPSYAKIIPRDPSLATSSALIGYTITRSENNDIVLAAKSPEDGAIIKATCNFNGYCKNIEYISKVIYKRPMVTSLNRNSFLRDSIPKTPLTILGENFTATNTVKLLSLYNRKEYTLGTFLAISPLTSTGTIPVEGKYLNQFFSCGVGCAQKLPLGEYEIQVSNEGGVSNTGHLVIKGFTTSSISTRESGSITPTSKNVRVASITVSSSIPISITSLTLTSTSSSKNLTSKISNFVLKDVSDGTTYGGGSAGSFTLSGVSMYENQSRVYDVYIDTDEVYTEDTGFITYGGKFLVHDAFTNLDMELPIKEFSFTVSR